MRLFVSAACPLRVFKFNVYVCSQLLIVSESIDLHQEIADSLVSLRRLALSKVNPEHSKPSLDLLDKLAT